MRLWWFCLPVLKMSHLLVSQTDVQFSVQYSWDVVHLRCSECLFVKSLSFLLSVIILVKNYFWYFCCFPSIFEERMGNHPLKWFFFTQCVLIEFKLNNVKQVCSRLGKKSLKTFKCSSGYSENSFDDLTEKFWQKYETFSSMSKMFCNNNSEKIFLSKSSFGHGESSFDIPAKKFSLTSQNIFFHVWNCLWNFSWEKLS